MYSICLQIIQIIQCIMMMDKSDFLNMFEHQKLPQWFFPVFTVQCSNSTPADRSNTGSKLLQSLVKRKI